MIWMNTIDNSCLYHYTYPKVQRRWTSMGHNQGDRSLFATRSPSLFRRSRKEADDLRARPENNATICYSYVLRTRARERTSARHADVRMGIWSASTGGVSSRQCLREVYMWCSLRMSPDGANLTKSSHGGDKLCALYPFRRNYRLI